MRVILPGPLRNARIILGLLAILALLRAPFWRSIESPGVLLFQGGAAGGQIDDPIKVTMTVCRGDEPKKYVDSIERQKLQLITAVKAAVFLTRRHLSFAIIGDTKDVYDDLVAESGTWPAYQRSKASIQFVEVQYPPKYAHFKTMFRPCATLRLFLPSILPDDDAVVYMDSDVILLRPLEEFWNYITQMDTTQLAAGVSFVGGYSSRPQHRRHGKDGFNSGLMLFNLTRARRFPGGWEDSIASIAQRYKNQLPLADQDILNILFSGNSKYFQLLGCEWNFRSIYFSEKILQTCPKLLSEGAKAVHGTSASFFSDKLMEAFFQSWADLNMTQTVPQFHDTLKKNLSSVKNDQFKNVLSRQLIVAKSGNQTQEN